MRFGFVGLEDVDAAIGALKSDKVLLSDKVFHIEIPHRGNAPKVSMYDDISQIEGVYTVDREAGAVIVEMENGERREFRGEGEASSFIAREICDGKTSRIYRYDDMIRVLEGCLHREEIDDECEAIVIAALRGWL